jgi:MFS family permease
MRIQVMAINVVRSDTLPKRSSLWYGWVVLAVVFIVMSTMVGVRNSLGFFFKTISGEFGWNRAQTAGAFSIGMIVQGICSPLFGSLGERWSLRWMMATGFSSAARRCLSARRSAASGSFI